MFYGNIDYRVADSQVRAPGELPSGRWKKSGQVSAWGEWDVHFGKNGRLLCATAPADANVWRVDQPTLTGRLPRALRQLSRPIFGVVRPCACGDLDLGGVILTTAIAPRPSDRYAMCVAITNDLKHADLNAVLKTALDAVVVMRVDGTIAGWNDVATRIFGWSFDEARGRRMSEMIIPPQHREAHERGLSHFFATGEGPVLDRHIEITALRRDGHELPIELSITFTRQFDEPVFLGFLRDISERQEAHRQQELLLAELSHRVKNMLAVVSGMAAQTARSSSSMDTFIQAFSGRLDALAKGHDMLTRNSWEGGALSDLAEALLGPYALPSDMRATFGGPPVSLDAKQILSLSMILHELITNATKYGALAHPEGRVEVNWNWSTAEHPGWLHFAWKESGLRDITAPARNGFGLKMIALSAGHELGGSSSLEWQNDGLLFTMEFPGRQAT